MSHYTLGIVIPKEIFESSEESILSYINSQMNKFDENLQISPYIKYHFSKKDEYFEERIENYKKILEDVDDTVYNKEYISKKLKEYNNMSSDEFWNKNIKDYGDVDEHGNVLSTYNPNSKWDWYVIGGRWSGEFTDDIILEQNNRFEIDEIIKENSQTLKSYIQKYNESEKYRMFAYLDKNGNWLERGEMGWFAIVSNENLDFNEMVNKFLQEQNEEDYIINLDCHI